MCFFKKRSQLLDKVPGVETYGNLMFYVLLCIFLIMQFSSGTMIYESYLTADFPYEVIMIVSFILAVKIFLMDEFSSLQEMLLYLSFGLLLWISCKLAETYDIVYYYIFIVGARNKDFKVITRIFLLTISVSLLITIISAKIGLLLGLTIGRTDDTVIRYALGTVYPTDLAARTFYLQLMYVVLRKFKLTIPEFIAGFAFSIMMYIITDTRVDAALMIATLFIAIGYKYAMSILDFLGNKVLILLGMLSVFGMIGLTYIYTPKIGILRIVDKLLSTRLQNGHGAFENYNVTMFGQYIFQQGNGGLHTKPFHYFFIDCTFIRVLMMNGLVVFMLFMWGLCYMLKRFMNNRAYSLVWALILIVISSLIDHHMTELSFDIIFLAMFSNISYFIEYKENKKIV